MGSTSRLTSIVAMTGLGYSNMIDKAETAEARTKKPAKATTKKAAKAAQPLSEHE